MNPGNNQRGDETGKLGVCRRCGGVMIPSKALNGLYVGSPDFPGDRGNERGCTVNVSGQTELIDCMKCEDCGWSVTSVQTKTEEKG